MAEIRRERDKRFYFSRGQLVLLGGAFTLASLIIFFLGIVVGRGIEERKMAQPEEPLIKIPVNPSAHSGAKGPAGQGPEELTFYDTLAQSANSESSPQKRAGEPKPSEKADQSARAMRTQDSSSAVSSRTAEKPSGEKPKDPPVSDTTAESVKAWYVQVNAFPDEKSGQIFVDKLRNKGYKAYLAEGRNQGQLWYRVRVGEFSSREEAERIAEILKSKENFPKAFAARQ